MARVFKANPPRSSLRFVFFDAEERGLLGSRHFVRSPKHLKDVRGVIVLEMIGYTCSKLGCQAYPDGIPTLLRRPSGDFVTVVGNVEHLNLMRVFGEVGRENQIDVVAIPVPNQGHNMPDTRRSDHAPFWDHGVAAVMVTDTANFRNPHYHTAEDKPDTIDLVFFRDTPVRADSAQGEERPLGIILRQPVVILAIASAVVGYSIMSLIMTATPVSMHEMDHHSLDETTWVVQSHILAMYIPSFFSGFLVARFGVMRIIQSGFLLMLVCVVVGWGRPDLMHYFGTMVLLGVGWNFLFLGGTTLLTQSYRVSERFKVQAANDFMIFGLQAIGSLGAGVLLATMGWNGVLAFSLPWLLLLIPVAIYANKYLAARQS